MVGRPRRTEQLTRARLDQVRRASGGWVPDAGPPGPPRLGGGDPAGRDGAEPMAGPRPAEPMAGPRPAEPMAGPRPAEPASASDAFGPVTAEAPAAPGRAGALARLVDRVLPQRLQAARLDPGRRGLAVLVAVGLLAGGLAGVAAWRSRPQPVAVAAPEPATARPAISGATGRPATSGAPGSMVVAVVGKVRRPGLLRLPPGARVDDAVRAAGGALPGVDLGALNLARRLVDGEQIVVGAPAAAGPSGATGGPAGAPPVNLNTATVADLDRLPGVGPVLAQRIVAHRDRIGGFRAVEQLREVDGIGESRFADLRPLVTV